jgi:hypothetical protein
MLCNAFFGDIVGVYCEVQLGDDAWDECRDMKATFGKNIHFFYLHNWPRFRKTCNLFLVKVYICLVMSIKST